jgi:tetratricopeptide (TPR) repeat protein
MTGIELARAKTMLDLKRYDEAARLLVHIVAAEPADSRAWGMLAAAQLGNSQYREAATAASQAVTLAPADDWPHRLVSTAQLNLGDTATALRAAHEACRLAPDQWRAYLCLAQAELATQVHFKAAEQAAARARNLAPDEPSVHFISGKISLAQGHRKAARAHQERALALDPQHSGALNELGRISLRPTSNARAARHFVQAARAAPQVGAYSRNVEVVVRRVVNLVIYLTSMACLALMYVTTATNLTRAPVVLGFTAIVALSVGLAAVQFLRMPPETRPLFRTGRVARALGLVYGAILLALVVAAVAPARALTGAVLAATVVIFASRFAAYAILRRPRAATPPR